MLRVRLVTSDLTASRLAQHDSKFTPLTSVQPRNDDVLSYTTTTTTDAATAYYLVCPLSSSLCVCRMMVVVVRKLGIGLILELL